MRRWLLGSFLGVSSAVGLGACLVPIRSHISISTAALILVIPVVAGVVIGGFRAGILSVVAGFLVYDFWFIPPYQTLTVGNGQNWVALGVYTVVMLLVARVVASFDAARAEALRRTLTTRRLYELSKLLVENRSVDDLLQTIVRAVSMDFDVPSVSLLVLKDEQLVVAASAGDALTQEELHQLAPQSGLPVAVGTASGTVGELRTIALSAAGRPIGMLALRGIPDSSADRALLTTFANQAALALERAQLRDQAMRSELLEEVDRLRHVLLGAVSHDLRTPLATIRVASSTLYNRASSLSPEDTRELHHLIEIESGRLTRLVTNLLDMTRVEAGVLEIVRTPTSLRSLIDDAKAALGVSLDESRLKVELPVVVPVLEIDPLLIGQVLINLLDNAIRFAPPNTPIVVSAEIHETQLTLAVSNEGPSIEESKKEVLFKSFAQFDTGGRAGLGLAIARTFVEAHGEKIWVENTNDVGVRFVFTLPLGTVARN